MSAHYLVLPVMCWRITVEIEVMWVAEVVAEQICLLVVILRCATSCCVVPLIVYVVVSIHEFQFFGKLTDRPLGVEVNLGLALGGTLGGDYDYAVAALGSVDSGQGGILEDVNRLNIRGGMSFMLSVWNPSTM